MTIIEIKNYMKKNKITYEMLSEKSNIPITTLKQIFCGKTKSPRIDTLNAITTALGLPSNENGYILPDALNNVQLAFFEGIKDLTQEDLEDISNYIEFIKSRKNK